MHDVTPERQRRATQHDGQVGPDRGLHNGRRDPLVDGGRIGGFVAEPERRLVRRAVSANDAIDISTIGISTIDVVRAADRPPSQRA